MRGLVIAAPSSGQGKTVLTLGLLRAFRGRGLNIASGKSGPDYIDPAFHEAATGRPCVTLDAFAADAAQLRARAALQAPADLLVVEGAMGLFDGAPSGGAVGEGAASQVAAALGLPVVLVLDAARMGQTAGAIVAGLATWSQDIAVAGVLLNRVASARHETMLRQAIEPVCPVLGVIPRDGALELPSRHLGLVQAAEMVELEGFISHAGSVISNHADLNALINLAGILSVDHEVSRRLPPLGQHIAVARDEAFSFCYWHMLQDWRAQGATLSFFSPLADHGPADDADAVFLPGGYPELYAGRLARAQGFHAGMARARSRDACIYGECGGYMVLGESLVDESGTGHAMLGYLKLQTSFADRKRHLGYRHLIGQGSLRGAYAGHEFHYATTLKAVGEPLFQATDGTGVQIEPMGLREDRVLGSFAHLIEPV